MPNPSRSSSTVERLEPRLQLSADSLTPIKAPGGNAIDLGQTYSAGDYYLADGKPVQLLRSRGQIIVSTQGLSATQIRHRARNAGLLADVSNTEIVDDNLLTLTDTDPAGNNLHRVLTGLRRFANLSWTAPVFVDPATGQQVHIGGSVVVALKAGVNPETFFADGYTGYRPLLGTADQFIADLAGGAFSSLTKAIALGKDARVQWASPEMYQRITPSAMPNDPLVGEQWHLNNTGQTGAKVDADSDINEAWNSETGSKNVVVAVLDNGVQVNHPDLAGNIFVNAGEIAANGIDDDANGWIDDVNGWDFADNDNNPNPATIYDDHGTSVAGVIAAVGNNGVGVSGVSRTSKILPVKISKDTDGSGGGFISDANIATAVYYASGRTANGLGTWRSGDILNNSWGGGSSNSTLTAAFTYATASGRGGLGAPVLAAAGNSASDYGLYSVPLAAGNWMIEFRYSKNASVNSGSDTAWLSPVVFPDGSIERFDSLGLPAGWTTSGNANWSVVDDPAHAYGTGRYQAKAGAITHNQTTILRTPSFTATGTDAAILLGLWVSSQTSDLLGVYSSNNGGSSWTFEGSLAGNTAVIPNASYPASLSSSNSGLMAVGGSTDWDYRADYAQYGSALDFVAPTSGGYASIQTTDRTSADGYNPTAGTTGDYTGDADYGFGGTSSATPLAAGIAALLLSKNPSLTAATVKTTLRNTADKIGNVTYTSGFNTYYGYGRVNANAALAAVSADLTGPVITNTVLTTDTGASSTDRVTSDTTLTLTYTFDQKTYWTPADITITAPNASPVVPTSITGVGTTTMTITLPTLSLNGAYTVTLGAGVADQAENALNAGAGQVTNFTLDTVPPTVQSINRVGASPTSLNTVQFAVTFAESVTGVDLTDFSLASSGLTGASLSGISGSGASYTVTVNTGDGTGNGTLGLNLVDNDSILDTAGQALGGAGAGNANFTGQTYAIYPHVFNGTAGADTYHVRANGALDEILINNVLTYSIDRTQLPSLTFNTQGGDDTLIIDHSQGDPTPTGGIAYTGGANSDTLEIRGTGLADTFTLGSTTVTQGLTSASWSAESLTLKTGTYNAPSALVLTGVVVDTARLAFAASAGTVVLDTLTITAGKLDLNNNDMILKGGAAQYAAVNALLASAFATGNWSGNGLASSAAPSAGNTGLGLLTGQQFLANSALTTFNGQPVANNDLLIKYTQHGDSNLDGAVEDDDLFLFLPNYTGPQTGDWLAGDYTYDGLVDDSDLFLFLPNYTA